MVRGEESVETRGQRATGVVYYSDYLRMVDCGVQRMLPEELQGQGDGRDRAEEYERLQEVALCYAAQRLSGERERSGKEWVRWNDGGLLSKGAKAQYPEPNLDAWIAELKAEFGGES